MTSRYRHRRTPTAATAFPNPVEPGEIVVNTANRQIAVGDAAGATLGAPKQLIGVRFFDTTAQYAPNDFVISGGNQYRAKAPIMPGPFNASQWDLYAPAGVAGVTADGVIFTPVGNVSSSNVQTAIAEVDSEKVAKAGDVMAGHLQLPAGPAANQAVRKDYVDAAISTLDASIGADTDALATAKVAKAGDVMSGALTLPSDPTVNLHAATKQYVDANAGTVRVSDVPPAGVKDGTLWWESDTGQLYVRYNDLSGVPQWVIAAPQPDTQQYIAEAPVDGKVYGRKNYVWTAAVNLAGDTMSGHLTLPAGPGPANAVRKDYVDAADAALQTGKVAKSGDTMTGSLLINGANPFMGLNKTASGQTNQIYGYTNSTVRWEMDLGSQAAESGGNAGSDFLLSRFNDAGAWLATAMLITRSTGAVNFYSTLNAPTVVAIGDVGANRVVINSAGYVLVDTAKFYSDGNQSTWYYNGDACFVNYTKANGNLQFTVNNAITFQHVYATHSFYVDGAAFKPGGSVWSDSSDFRIKNVQGEYKAGLDAVAALQPIIYTFKGNDTLEVPDYVRTQAEKEEAARKARETDVPEAPVSVPYPNSPHYQAAKDQKLFHGLIAQEVEKVFPEMISKRAGFLNGEPVSDIRDMDTSPLIYALVNAVKELKARVEALEAGVA
jgi:hypothetical protein